MPEFSKMCTVRDVHGQTVHLPSTPVGIITVNFGEAEGNIDLSELIADSDVKEGKSILYMENWPKEVERSKILFIPKK